MLYNTLCNCIINIYFSYIYLLEVEKKVDNYGSMFQQRDKKWKDNYELSHDSDCFSCNS